MNGIALSGLRSYSRLSFIFLKEEINVLNDMKNDNSIVVMKPDKGNDVVILDKTDYNNKISEILSDSSKFELINEDPVKVTLQRETQVKSLLKQPKKTKSIDEQTYNKLYPTGSRIGTPPTTLLRQTILKSSHPAPTHSTS
ncbi:uncharacterized protein LOC124451539 [Xenia sp. Carnegie-2017]|uniref:uncharacterized protein LOC124451539 n=1 Tax=Xenia sp. Carnegie-2017 TaxID=2897299 RepID=UPI001F03A976|nr:uncharacterized protein LOC124451539 [Xenia sp. Carnegie-2017]